MLRLLQTWLSPNDSSSDSDYHHHRQLHSPLSIQDDSVPVLVSGPKGCGKTSLLFNLAISRASLGSDRRSIYLCASRDKLYAHPPRLLSEHQLGAASASLTSELAVATAAAAAAAAAASPSSSVAAVSALARVEICYLSSLEDLIKYLARLHAIREEPPPCHISIDDLDIFFSGQEHTLVVRALVLMRNVANWAGEQLQKRAVEDASSVGAKSPEVVAGEPAAAAAAAATVEAVVRPHVCCTLSVSHLQVPQMESGRLRDHLRKWFPLMLRVGRQADGNFAVVGAMGASQISGGGGGRSMTSIALGHIASYSLAGNTLKPLPLKRWQ